MGIFSKHHRYREAGEAANVNNVAAFGEPIKSLFTTSKVFSLHHHIDITDENENVVYHAQSKAISLHDTTTIVDSQKRLIAQISAKVFSIHEKHTVTMADGTTFVLSTELLHLVKDVINIEGLGWQIRGNIAALNFELYDATDNIIANIAQKMVSLHDKYCIDIYQPEYEHIVVAILITLQHMIKDREASSSSSSSF